MIDPYKIAKLIILILFTLIIIAYYVGNVRGVIRGRKEIIHQYSSCIQKL